MYVFGEFPRSPGGSFEKFSGLYSGRPRGRSLSFVTLVRESVSLGLFHQFTAVNLFGDDFHSIDESIVSAVILPQIGELPVRLSIGEV